MPAPQWITRRRLLLAGGGIVAAAGASRLAAAQGPNAQGPNALGPKKLTVALALQFIRRAGDKLVTIVNGPGDWTYKRRQLQLLVNAAVDVGGVGRFALGRYWSSASEQQQAEFERLLPLVLIGSVARAVGAYQGLAFTVDGGVPMNDEVAVRTTILRPGDPPRQVNWMIGTVAGAPKIVDVIAEGASMRITERDDCSSYLRQNNHTIQTLIDMLQQREAEATT